MKYYGLIMPSVFPTGVFIQDIKQTVNSNESEGLNTMTVTLTNQQKAYFHVKNGKAGSALEATAQMEKHAKEYIASELQEQKTALEQAISNLVAKTDTELKQKVSEAVLKFESLIQEKEKNLETKLLEKANTNVIKLLQNGYIQWPGMPSPDTIFDFPDYRWVEVDYNGCFFRAKGSGALPFNDGEQSDAIREIQGSFLSGRKVGTQEEKEFMQKHTKGCFSLKFNGRDRYVASSVHIGTETHIVFNSSRSIPTAEENRPRNRTIIIWKLEKIDKEREE